MRDGRTLFVLPANRCRRTWIARREMPVASVTVDTLVVAAQRQRPRVTRRCRSFNTASTSANRRRTAASMLSVRMDAAYPKAA
jgi:peptide subunit release factor 1 (eRF1)